MLIVTPAIIKFAHKADFTEKPKPDVERKIHKEPKAYLASIGIFVIYWLCCVIFIRDLDRTDFMIFLASLIILLVGLVDDWFKIRGRDLKAWPKFIVQAGACLLVCFSGIRVTGFTVPFTGYYLEIAPGLQVVLTVLWIFGVTTVINFTDGLDGLAGGIAGISASVFFLLAIIKQYEEFAFMSIILIGVCLGYLKYNKYPSQILMGDSGATFLGFMLGVISIEAAFKQAAVVSIVVPVLALGLPIFDNLFVVIKRMREKRPVYEGDSSQIHYRLLNKGLSQKQVVNYLYLVNIGLCLLAVIFIFV